MRRLRTNYRRAAGLVKDERGSALLEFAIVLPLLVVFVVGIYDFSGAFNQKQKMAQAAQEGAILAGAQPTSDIEIGDGSPVSLQPVVAAVFNSLAASGVLPQANSGSCQAASNTVTQPAGTLQWNYAISGCPDTLTIVIERGWVPSVPSTTKSVGTLIEVTYPYRWRFNSVVQLLVPGASYNAITYLVEVAKVHNQM